MGGIVGLSDVELIIIENLQTFNFAKLRSMLKDKQFAEEDDTAIYETRAVWIKFAPQSKI